MNHPSECVTRERPALGLHYVPETAFLPASLFTLLASLLVFLAA